MSTAGESEAVVSNSFYQRMPEEIQGRFSESEPVEARNIGRWKFVRTELSKLPGDSMTSKLSFITALCLIAGCAGGFVVGCGTESSQTPNTPAASPVTGAGPRVVEIAANRGWQDSGISVSPQQRFQLRYRSGHITDKDTKITDAHGSDYVCGDPGCCEPLPDERRASLVARVGTDVFAVGNGGEFSSPSGGAIFLRVNDCDEGLGDNTGNLNVEFIP